MFLETNKIYKIFNAMCYSRKKKMKLTRHLKLDWSFQWGSGKAHRAGNAHSVSDSAAEELASQAGGVGSEPWVIFTFFPFSFFFFPWLYTQISYLCSSRTFFSVQCLANTFKAKTCSVQDTLSILSGFPFGLHNILCCFFLT